MAATASPALKILLNSLSEMVPNYNIKLCTFAVKAHRFKVTKTWKNNMENFVNKTFNGLPFLDQFVFPLI